MAEGAVTLTDASSFLAGDFADGREILYLPNTKQRDGLAELASVLARDADLQKMADGAAAVYAEKHTWKERVRLLHQAMIDA